MKKLPFVLALDSALEKGAGFTNGIVTLRWNKTFLDQHGNKHVVTKKELLTDLWEVVDVGSNRPS